MPSSWQHCWNQMTRRALALLQPFFFYFFVPARFSRKIRVTNLSKTMRQNVAPSLIFSHHSPHSLVPLLLPLWAFGTLSASWLPRPWGGRGVNSPQPSVLASPSGFSGSGVFGRVTAAESALSGQIAASDNKAAWQRDGGISITEPVCSHMHGLKLLTNV